MSLRALEIARSAMLARQTEIDVISHNVANVSTPGYCRRRAILAPVPSERIAHGWASGLGVKVTSIQRTGDRLLEAQIALESGSLGRSQAMSASLNELEAIVAGSSGRGLLDPLNALFGSFADIASDPGGSTARQQAVENAQVLCDGFRRADAALQGAVQRNDEQFVAAVRQVNHLAQEIAEINRVIGTAGGAGRAPDLEDQRSAALSELATLVGASAVNSGNGEISVLVGGHYLVQGGTAAPMQIVSDPATPWLHNVSFGGKTPPAALDGSLQGLLTARTDGLQRVRTELNEFAAKVADAINGVHAGGYGLDGVTGRNFLEYDPTNPAATLSVSAEIVADPDRIAAASNPGEAGNGVNALLLEQLRNTPPPGENRSLLTTHTDFLASLGVDVRLARARTDSRETVVFALQARADAASGVVLDEEALRLAETQKAYSAAQRVVAVALEMIDAALRIGDY